MKDNKNTRKILKEVIRTTFEFLAIHMFTLIKALDLAKLINIGGIRIWSVHRYCNEVYYYIGPAPKAAYTITYNFKARKDTLLIAIIFLDY